MKTIAGTLLIIIFAIQAFAQGENIDIPVNQRGDTTFSYKWNQDLAKELGLANVANSQSDFYFRIWHHGQVLSHVIDIRSTNDSTYKAIITLYTKEFIDNTKEEPTNRIFSKNTELNSVTGSRLHKLIQSQKINSIPSEDSIAGWSRGFDGDTYTIEFADKNRYSFKSYWTPAAHDSLKEATLLRDFIYDLNKIVEMGLRLSAFSSEVPFECYNTGGPATACKVLSRKEHRKLKKERESYRQRQLKPINEP